jgi:tetratricopeptide (TPR) repeat protein
MIDELIRKGEGRKCDFKREFYKLPHDKGELAKDLMAFANSTKQNEPDSIILIGYKNGDFFNVDDSSIIDEASIQQQIDSLVEPPLIFSVEKIYHTKGENTYSLAMIRIPPSSRKPHVVAKDLRPSLHEGQCYIRRGSSTAKAKRVEIAEMVYDADRNRNPYKRLVRYLDSLQKTGQRINITEIDNLLYQDMIPHFCAPMVCNLDIVRKNSDGISVYFPSLTAMENQAQCENLDQAIECFENEDLELARTFIEKIPKIESNISACLIGADIYSDLEEYEKSSRLIGRALEIEPNIINTNFAAAQLSHKKNENGEAILFYEKALECREDCGDNIMIKIVLFELGSLYAQLGIKGRSKQLMQEFLDIHSDDDEYKREAEGIVGHFSGGGLR